MKVFVANTTKQHFMFTYRVPEKKEPTMQVIPAGSQICLAPNGSNIDLTPEEVKSILQQYENYGMQPADNIAEVFETEHGKRKFSGLVYQFDKPISIERLRKAIAKKEQMTVKEGKEIREDAGVVANYEIEQRVREGFQLRKGLSMTIEEQEPTRGFDDNLSHISEEHSITRNPDTSRSVVDIMKRSR